MKEISPITATHLFRAYRDKVNDIIRRMNNHTVEIATLKDNISQAIRQKYEVNWAGHKIVLENNTIDIQLSTNDYVLIVYTPEFVAIEINHKNSKVLHKFDRVLARWVMGTPSLYCVDGELEVNIGSSDVDLFHCHDEWNELLFTSECEFTMRTRCNRIVYKNNTITHHIMMTT
jgi:hypothetical protein